MGYRPQHYKIQELVNPKLLSEFGEAKCWEMLDADLLYMADAIRDKYGAIGVNYGGLVDCGLRDWRNPTTGSSASAHCHGKALDLHILNIPQTVGAYDKVREELLDNAMFLRLCFETGVNWLHIDINNREYRTFSA
ncbi:hypothetical protein NO2_0419 [Candidatus Termititenax persephonae]|uniref:Peptidase M15 n=1 Tax=Candidatus Termititenax persephonae TaxID=2218525 RepID=A0A388TFF6_9BACT|nr:hypothetical protein NO2_0419 [Candidatus Termititenax persephonae]